MSQEKSSRLDYTLKMKMWIDIGEKTLIGEGRREILRAISETGSLAGAARKLGMSYKKVIFSIEEMEEALGRKLVERYKGGAKKGGARLTKLGEALLRAYDEAEKRAMESASKVWENFFSRI